MDDYVSLDESQTKIDQYFANGFDKGIFHEVSSVLRRVNYSKEQDVPTRVNDHLGIPAQSEKQGALIMQKHFAGVMKAEISNFSAIINRDTLQDNDGRFKEVDPKEIWKSLPSSTRTYPKYRARKKGKAGGEDNITGDPISTFAKYLLPTLTPLNIKSYVRMSPPIQWKGGQVVALFKNKGKRSVPGNYRDIMLGNDIGKSLITFTREYIAPIITFMSLETQFGSGMNGGETACAHL